MKCPKDNREVTADDCEDCVSERHCFEWYLDHIVWGTIGESLFTHPMGKYGEDFGHLLEPPPAEPIAVPSPRKQPIPDALRWEVWERDNFTCKSCQTRQFLTIDHIIPRALGGQDTKDNLQTLCKSCNNKKGKKLTGYY